MDWEFTYQCKYSKGLDYAVHILIKIYLSRIDPGSPSEEAGLQVGDQILDVNGHSFHSILHFEAVHILRSYDTLIMTIKVTGMETA